jgi:hypothetical protein
MKKRKLSALGITNSVVFGVLLGIIIHVDWQILLVLAGFMLIIVWLLANLQAISDW